MYKRLVFICLLLLCGMATASTLSINSVTVNLLSTTGTGHMVLDSAPNGLSGCNITLAVANGSVATLQAAYSPYWSTITSSGSLPGTTLTFSEADLTNQITAGATNVPIVNVTITGLAQGTTSFTITVNQMDDDNGAAITPTTSGGTITVNAAPTPTPTPSITPVIPGGNAGPYQIPDVPFPTVNTSGIHMISAAVNNTTKIVTLIGKIDNTTLNPVGWFMIGDPPGQYSYFTVAYPPNATGYVTIPFGTGSPLNPGEIFYVRMASHNGRSAEEVTFYTPALTPLPTSNFSQYFYNIQYSNHSPLTMLAAVPLPLVDLFGAGSQKFGWMVFFTIMFGIICVVLVVRQDNIALVFEGVCMAAGLILYLIDPEFIWIIFAFCAIAAATILYRLYRRE